MFFHLHLKTTTRHRRRRCPGKEHGCGTEGWYNFHYGVCYFTNLALVVGLLPARFKSPHGRITSSGHYAIPSCQLLPYGHGRRLFHAEMKWAQVFQAAPSSAVVTFAKMFAPGSRRTAVRMMSCSTARYCFWMKNQSPAVSDAALNAEKWKVINIAAVARSCVAI